MIQSKRLYYTFPIAPSVLGISLDTVNHGGYADGSIGVAQLTWLEQRLIGASSKYYDAGGVLVNTGNADQLVVLFSHHNQFTMGNPVPDVNLPGDQRKTFTELRALLSRFPNVVAWVNGHTHVNQITPVPDPSGRTGGFWEITTAAHVDWPEHARTVEIVANCDGTISIFCVVLEHAGAPTANHADRTVLGLASISRELAANDPQMNPAAIGAPTDLNVELVIRAPFDVCPAPFSVPLTAGAAMGGTLALRRRAGAS